MNFNNAQSLWNNNSWLIDDLMEPLPELTGSAGVTQLTRSPEARIVQNIGRTQEIRTDFASAIELQDQKLNDLAEMFGMTRSEVDSLGINQIYLDASKQEWLSGIGTENVEFSDSEFASMLNELPYESSSTEAPVLEDSAPTPRFCPANPRPSPASRTSSTDDEVIEEVDMGARANDRQKNMYR